jgi:hypothetical protein
MLSSKEAPMMMTQEHAFLKAQNHFQALLHFVQQALDQPQRIDQVERGLFRQLLHLGLLLLEAFVVSHGDGDVGPTTTAPDGLPCRRLPQPHTRPYRCVFGELSISRFVYGTREGQAIEAVPLDQQLGLPANDFSYLLTDWAQRLCLKESFAEAGQSLETLLGLSLGVRTLEAMNQRLASFADGFDNQQAPPPAEEEGAILVVTADGKGVPMRRPPQERVRAHHRRSKGEKANKKQMAYVGAVYSIDPFVRTVEDVIDDVFRRERAQMRPRPQHKRVRAEMTRARDGETVQNGKEALFGNLSDEVARRIRGHPAPLVCVLDGERALWDKRAEYFPQSVGVLDLFHVLERLWVAAHAWHAEGSEAAEGFVRARLRLLLEGKVGQVIGGLRRQLRQEPVSASRRRSVRAVIVYLANNRAYMKYDEYLAAGYPIGSGVVEGACRHLVKDRMEQSGMRWSVAGAQAMLHTRALYLNGDWDNFCEYWVKTEQTKLYGEVAA